MIRTSKYAHEFKDSTIQLVMQGKQSVLQNREKFKSQKQYIIGLECIK